VKSYLRVSDLAALVLKELSDAVGVFDYLGAVRKAVNGLAILNGLDQGDLSGLPL